MRLNGLKTKLYLGMTDVRQVCIENNYYTRGDCRAYDKMLDMFNDGEVNEVTIMAAAQDIYEHSDVDRIEAECDTDVKGVMQSILNNLLYATRLLVDDIDFSVDYMDAD